MNEQQVIFLTVCICVGAFYGVLLFGLLRRVK